jgi:FAD/FMN-containing dehydrogenase
MGAGRAASSSDDVEAEALFDARNLHPLLVTPPGDEAARVAAQAAFEEFLDAAIALGGTVTGEHGVGLLKQDNPGKG